LNKKIYSFLKDTKKLSYSFIVFIIYLFIWILDTHYHQIH